MPKLGERFSFNTSVEVTFNNNLRIKPSIDSSRLKKLDSEEYFFDGYIARLDLRYQFNTAFNLRIISEYNELISLSIQSSLSSIQLLRNSISSS